MNSELSIGRLSAALGAEVRGIALNDFDVEEEHGNRG